MAASVNSGVSNEAPSLANTKSRTACLSAVCPSTLSKLWMPGHASWLPNMIGVSPASLASCSDASNSSSVVGGVGTFSLL